MKNLTKTVMCLFLLACINYQLKSQELTKSVIHELSKKADKGSLYDYLIDSENNQVELAYLLKETKKELTMETYVFKLEDLTFVSSKEHIIQKDKSEYKRLKKANSKPTKLLKISPNFVTGNIVMKRGYISYGYAGRAVISNFVSEDGGVKVRTQGGDKFIYISHKTESQDLTGKTTIMDQHGGGANVNSAGTFGYGYVSIGEGNVSIMGMEKTKPYYSRYAFTIYDAKTRTEKLYKTYDLNYSYSPISVKYLNNGNIGIALWPIQTEFLPKTKSAQEKYNCDPNKNFKYIEINTVGEKVVDVDFQMEIGKKGGQYNLEILQTGIEGEVVLLGLSDPETYCIGTAASPKYIAPVHPVDSPIGLRKPKKVIAIKISNNEVVYSSETEIEEWSPRIATTNDTKAPKPETLLQGYKASQTIIDNDGNILVNGIGDIHKAFQIAPDGKVTAYLDQQNQDLAQANELITNEAGEIYWVKFDIEQYDPNSSEDTQKALHKRTGTISKIDTKTGKILNTSSLSPDKTALDELEPINWINDNELLILGHGKKKEISLSKINIQ